MERNKNHQELFMIKIFYFINSCINLSILKKKKDPSCNKQNIYLLQFIVFCNDIFYK